MIFWVFLSHFLESLEIQIGPQSLFVPSQTFPNSNWIYRKMHQHLQYYQITFY